MKDSKKVITGLAAMGAVIGTGMLISKMKEEQKSHFEKFVDQISDYLKS